jgi:hypothetical protein
MLFIAGGLGFKTYIFFVVDDDRARARLLHRLLLHTPSYPLVLVLVHARVFVITAIALALARSLSEKVFIAPQLPNVLVKKWIGPPRRFGRLPRVLSLILARLQEEEIQRIFVLLLVCQQPSPDIIIFVQEDELGQRERNLGIPPQPPRKP